MLNNNYRLPERDQAGFLLNPATWDRTCAELIAAEENIVLTAAHWEIIDFLRKFYAEYNMSPGMRALVTALQEDTKNSAINSIYLYRLFPQGPAQQANKIAGLPKPIRCI